jgi:hypothetical protein
VELFGQSVGEAEPPPSSGLLASQKFITHPRDKTESYCRKPVGTASVVALRIVAIAVLPLCVRM